MRTYLECIPCFFNQILAAAQLCGASRAKQRKLIYKLAEILPEFSLSSPPPQMGRTIYQLVAKETGKKDVFKQIKEKSNKLALKLYPKLKRKIEASHDRLLIAVELAIAGNIIDYGVKSSLNVDEEIKKILHAEVRAIKSEKKELFKYHRFRNAIRKANTILYLADNAGETVFDRMLIEEIKKLDKNKKFIYAVKAKPIINDALIKDALCCGIDKIAQVISSGADGPGTILSLCTKEFLKLFREADLVISKGQGNFESLSDAPRREVFFLFMAKCSVVAKHLGCRMGDVILVCS